MHRNVSLPICRALLTLALTIVGASPAAAQPRPQEPHLAYAFPAGCQRGTSGEIVLGGQHLKEVKGAYVAGGGVQAEIVKWYRPLTRGEFNQLRTALEDARKKLQEQGKEKPSDQEVATAARITEEQLREMEIHLQRERDPKRQPNEQLEEELTIKVTVAADAERGKRELRLLGDAAVSNPLWIHVGQRPEVRETEPNDATPDAAISQFPVVVNGQIMPGDTDIRSPVCNIFGDIHRTGEEDLDMGVEGFCYQAALLTGFRKVEPAFFHKVHDRGGDPSFAGDREP